MIDSRHPSFPQSDDSVIGRAFKRSLFTLLVIALLIGAGYVITWWMDRSAPIPTEEAPVVAPLPSAPDVVGSPALPFRDVSEAAGIRFWHVNGAAGERLLPETMGSGVAFFDYDGDTDQDLLVINGRQWETEAGSGEERPTMALYANDGTGQFQDVTSGSGLDAEIFGMGVAIGDYDGDGRPDVFVTAVGPNRLFRNLGGRFDEVTESAGVGGAGDAWSTGAAFLDYDRDGDLDLFVANYVRWTREIDFGVDFRLTGIGRAYGPPTAFAGAQPYLYRNEGNGRFSEVAEAVGLWVANPATGAPVGKALGVVPTDVDRDGWLDLVVANDTVQNFLYRNLGDGRFEEIGTAAGLAFDRNGAATGAMGTDAAYFRNDADVGVAIGNFANEMTSLYVTQGGHPPMADESIVEGIGPVSRLALTFGLFFFDADLDGRLDLLQVNGHLEPEINAVQPSQHYRQAPQLFWNCGDDCRATYAEVPAAKIGDLSTPLVGRGAAFADIDADGDLDVAITQNGDAARLYRNDQAFGHHWLRVRLRGAEANRDALGAEVEAISGGIVQRRRVMPTRSYLSQVELPVTFGFGDSSQPAELRITWPDGSSQQVLDVALDREIVIEQSPGA